MWLRSVLLIYGVIACTLADNPSDIVPVSGDNLIRTKYVAATTYQPPRAVKIEEFVTAHKLPGNVARPSDDDDDDEYFDDKKIVLKDNKYAKKVIQKFENSEKKATLEPVRRLDLNADDDLEILSAKRQARVELENFSDTGKVLQDEKIKKVDSKRPSSEQDEVIPGVYVSAEYATTMLPVLTTSREAHGKDSPFDFVPVNIIREDSKNSYAHFSDANFGDLSDVSLIPAGTNSRIQVKKGPNGKDYEYEYVYYYYDEEDENKAERSSTVEPSNNEVIPNKNGNRGRQLLETEDVSEERLPANTRFPPRSRSNHNTATTESSRGRSNRPRPGLDLVDSSSFRTHQEGPEFPQTLPKGPVRFLGVTPNENNEEKQLVRNRGRPQRIQEPAPVEEEIDDALVPAIKRRPSSTATPETEVELSRGQPPRPNEEDDTENAEPEKPDNKRTSVEDKQESSETDSSGTIVDTTDNPTTEYPSTMDKVALDLYAFLQQGQNNLVDAFNSEAGETQDNTTIPDDEITTDIVTTTELTATTIDAESINPTTSTTTTTTTEPTTTTTTTEPSTTTTQIPIGRGKFRRPGIGGPGASRNRFKSNGGSSTSTEATVSEPTQKVRGRFGGGNLNGNGFKRPRPGGNFKPIEEDTIQKETSSSVNAEKPVSGRGRFRAPSASRTSVSTTTTTTTASTPSNGGASANGAAAARPAFSKLNINRRRGRPTTNAPGSDESQEAPQSETSAQTVGQIASEATTSAPKNAVRARLPGAPVIRPAAIRPPGGRVNLRQKPGQVTTSTTLAPEAAEAAIDEPAGEGTEEETHEAPAETSPPARSTTPNPLNKLRNRNRLQVHPKTTTKSPLPPSIRRSPLLPRRKVTETSPATQSQEDTSSEEEVTSFSETEPTSEATSVETSTAAKTKHDETRGLGGLLAPRRRIPVRRPGQIAQIQA
ncbi:Mucin-5AC [Camponotus japonicus]